jgi:hypothetical protein
MEEGSPAARPGSTVILGLIFTARNLALDEQTACGTVGA